ncbi:MAG: Phosphopantetheine attachment site [Paenibacillaceae bacterium]|nr:Phosphopantetheine attachment site [Paenibacillaceae bacterium]
MSYAAKNSVQQMIRSIIATIVRKPELEYQLHESQRLLEAGIDSMLLIHLVVQIEAEFNIAFPDEELLQENFSTIAVITENVMRKLGIHS